MNVCTWTTTPLIKKKVFPRVALLCCVCNSFTCVFFLRSCSSLEFTHCKMSGFYFWMESSVLYITTSIFSLQPQKIKKPTVKKHQSENELYFHLKQTLGWCDENHNDRPGITRRSHQTLFIYQSKQCFTGRPSNNRNHRNYGWIFFGKNSLVWKYLQSQSQGLNEPHLRWQVGGEGGKATTLLLKQWGEQKTEGLKLISMSLTFSNITIALIFIFVACQYAQTLYSFAVVRVSLRFSNVKKE